MTLKKDASDNAATLFHLIKNRSLTSIELRKLTKSSYPSARCFELKKKYGISFITTYERYVNRNKRTSRIARFTLATPLKDAKLIYKKIAA